MSIHVVSPHRRPLPDTTQCAVLYQNDPPPVDADLIGIVSYTTHFAFGEASHATQRTLQLAARRAGANLAKITAYFCDYQNPYRPETFTATLYKVDNIQAYEKEIAWNSRRRLTFADFKGRRDSVTPDTTLSHSQCEIFGAAARFDCMTSWIDPDRAESARLLIHEQGSFDLAECYNRQLRPFLRNHFLSLTASCQRPASQIMAAYQARQAEYDSATDHGLDDARQREWSHKIAVALADKTDTSFRGVVRM